jgi:hypothetical protein
MPSTEQIVNDIKAILNEIESSSALTAQEAGQIEKDAEAILETNTAGFANLSQGLATIVDREDSIVRLLEINDEQNRVILCWLQTLADLECKQLRQLEAQRQLQESLERTATNLRDIAHLVHSRETVEVEKDEETSRRLEECCPEEKPEPGPCFEPCKGREPPPHKPAVGEYKPLPQKNPRQPG